MMHDDMMHDMIHDMIHDMMHYMMHDMINIHIYFTYYNMCMRNVETLIKRERDNTTSFTCVLYFMSCHIWFGVSVQAVKSSEKIILGMPQEHLVQHFAPFVLNLANKDW